MRKRSGTVKTRNLRSRDANQSAFDAVQRVINLTEDAAERREKNPAAVALGRMGGLKGGPARRDAMTVAQRRESARKAAQARWKTKA